MNWSSLYRNDEAMSYFCGAFTQNLLRIVVGFLFIPHGLQKLFGVLGREAADDPLRLLAGVIEVFGGLLILVGFQTRWAAFLCSGMMAVAYWMVHGLRHPLPIMNAGEPAVLYCFVFLFLWANGGGDFSLDGLLKKKKA